MPLNRPIEPTDPSLWPQTNTPLRITVYPYSPPRATSNNPTNSDGTGDQSGAASNDFGNPFELPTVPVASRPDPFEDYFALMPASLAGATAWQPPNFPKNWPPTAVQNLPAAWVPPTTQISPWIGLSRFPNFGSSGALPASSRALPAAAYEPMSFPAYGGSFNKPNLTNSARSPFSSFLNALNPISPANAAEDEGGGLPPGLLQAVIQGLIDAATAKRLIEQNRILKEAQDARRELFEVAQGRASSRALGVSLEASGVPRPAGYAAHHIAAGADPRAAIARGVLQQFGIGINDAVNGVFLPANRATQVIAGETIHSKLHTEAYYEAVDKALQKANTREEAIGILRDIGQALQSGDYP